MPTNTLNITTNNPLVKTCTKKRGPSKKKIVKESSFCTDCTDDGDRLSKVVLCDKHYYDQK